MPERSKDKSHFLDMDEKDDLYHEIVDRIVCLIKNNFKDDLRIDELNTMARIYPSKEGVARFRYLYWVDFKKREYKNGKYGIRVHIQKISNYGFPDYKDPENRLTTEISFKNSGYPCFVIGDKEEMDSYFDDIIKCTYNLLVENLANRI